MRYAVDTNVLINANGGEGAEASGYEECQLMCVEFLESLMNGDSGHCILLDCQIPIGDDAESKIITEYRKHYSKTGVSGVGDIFIKFCRERFCVPNNKVETVDLIATENYDDWFENNARLPSTFDDDDKKFVAVARKGNGEIVNSTDSGYSTHKSNLGCGLKELCQGYIDAKL